jgi:hypothetical protein
MTIVMPSMIRVIRMITPCVDAIQPIAPPRRLNDVSNRSRRVVDGPVEVVAGRKDGIDVTVPFGRALSVFSHDASMYQERPRRVLQRPACYRAG